MNITLTIDGKPVTLTIDEAKDLFVDPSVPEPAWFAVLREVAHAALDRLEAIKLALEYDLRDLPPENAERQCDATIWRANMAAWKALQGSK